MYCCENPQGSIFVPGHHPLSPECDSCLATVSHQRYFRCLSHLSPSSSKGPRSGSPDSSLAISTFFFNLTGFVFVTTVVVVGALIAVFFLRLIEAVAFGSFEVLARDFFPGSFRDFVFSGLATFTSSPPLFDGPVSSPAPSSSDAVSAATGAAGVRNERDSWE